MEFSPTLRGADINTVVDKSNAMQQQQPSKVVAPVSMKRVNV
jgi:hypothetical protein